VGRKRYADRPAADKLREPDRPVRATYDPIQRDDVDAVAGSADGEPFRRRQRMRAGVEKNDRHAGPFGAKQRGSKERIHQHVRIATVGDHVARACRQVGFARYPVTGAVVAE
jgi:hypothetical protein